MRTVCTWGLWYTRPRASRGGARSAFTQVGSRKSGVGISTSNFRLPEVGFHFPTSDFQLPEVGFQVPTSNFRPPEVEFQLPTSNFRKLEVGLQERKKIPLGLGWVAFLKKQKKASEDASWKSKWATRNRSTCSRLDKNETKNQNWNGGGDKCKVSFSWDRFSDIQVSNCFLPFAWNPQYCLQHL